MVSTPVISVMGQQEYSSLTAAQLALWSDLDLTGFPIVEFRPLARVIYEIKNSYVAPNPFRAIIVNITDIRTFNQIGGAAGSDGPTGPTGPIGPTGAKSFIIDHPKDENKYLVHACLEGPEAGVYYRGISEITNEHHTIIELPDYVSNFAKDFTIHLTPMFKNKFVQLAYSEVDNNKFTVFSNNGNVKFSWIVYGNRLDINTEPYKNEVCVKGDGPYKWL